MEYSKAVGWLSNEFADAVREGAADMIQCREKIKNAELKMLNNCLPPFR